MNAITPTLDKKTLVALLKAFLPAENIITAEEGLRPYECDGLSAYRQTPLLVLLPDTIEQIQQIVRLCNKHKVPVVARGAGTGLSGGALPIANGVLLSLAKFNRILNLDTANRTATVQPGVRNLAISYAATPHGLYYAPDPSSQIACTIGGNIAENSGGVHCLKYGLTVHNVMQVTIVNMEGNLITLGSETLDSPGYDLLALICGSEGMLGIIVEAVVKLLTKPECADVILAAFDDIAKAAAAVSQIIGSGIIPAGLEMMDNNAICAAEEFVHVGYPTTAAAILLCELDGSQEEVESQTDRVYLLLEAAGASEIRIAGNAQERADFWKGRKSAFPAVGRLSPDYYCMDGTIPRKHLPRVLIRISELSEKYSLRVANVFHAGDGNLHPLILFDANKSGEFERAEAFGSEILELCIDVGGTITGEHGVGVEKIGQMCLQFSPLEIEQFHAIKKCFDPNSLLNPGKAIPTLHRCAEFGKMHVNQGKLPFPDIERF